MYILRGLILTMFMLYAASTFANGSRVITCDYNFENNSLMFGVGTLEKSVTITRRSGNLLYKVFIADINNFNEVNDFITVENDQGHKITYSLKCK